MIFADYNYFIINALVAGYGISLMTGPLGVFIVWRNMAYFGDTLAHGSLLGISLALALKLNVMLSVLLVSLLIAWLLFWWSRKTLLSQDAILGVLAHSALAFGLVSISLMQGLRVDLFGYLFGDLFAISAQDLLWIYLAVLGIYIILWRFWRSLLSVVISPELATVEGLKTNHMELLLVIMIAIVISLALMMVGALMIGAMLIIPAATARRFANSPEQMTVIATIIGILVVSLGLFFSWRYDAPAGPAIVASAGGLFAVSQLKAPR